MASDTSLERPLPHNLEAERSILGAVLLDNFALNAAIEKIRSEDFFLPQHRQIFERMVQLGEKQQAIDPVTLMEDLSRRGELEAAGGAAYISQLADGLPRVTNVEHYARIVKEKSVLRGLIHSAAAIQEQALAAGEDADVILDRAESVIFGLAEDRVKAGLIGVKELVRENFERLEQNFHRRPPHHRPRHRLRESRQRNSRASAIGADHPRRAPFDGKNGAGAEHRRKRRACATASPWRFSAWKCRRNRCSLRMLASEARIDAHKFRTGHMNRDDWSKIVTTLAGLWPKRRSGSTIPHLPP